MDDLFKCTGCSDEKERSSFGTKAGRRNTRCKDCVNKYYKDVYYADPSRREYIQGQNRKNAVKAKERAIEIVLSHFKSGCVDCGNEDVRVLEFDHLGDKEYSVSALINRNSTDKLIKEIEKCEVVCSNCHRIRTYSRGNSWRNAAVYPLADNE